MLVRSILFNIMFLLTFVVLGILFYLPLTLLAPVPATKAVEAGYTAAVTPTQTLSLPAYGDSAIAAVGYPGLLASGGGSTPLPIASITKIITALVMPGVRDGLRAPRVGFLSIRVILFPSGRARCPACGIARTRVRG